ncbi:MAG: cytochrome C oxidase subunit II [Gammaproteobacteria bacterium]|nr:cytochrome C oxidase subunit II [Gammaproteobacteria bacterium]MDP7296963.1 cytochrome C oxidase subunit II [Gammaproteobacteria bacterium]MDP7418958.1 cytochrome C oxidase subunit II [Gammaproteobacteria bacterium]MDP7660899.1 cytochrome C oxidase subunit II [Gammaproteobacteria bacterium]HJP38760.1 cytochrome C oxidase subunit II [Gammaproteobacteria bacterium]
MAILIAGIVMLVGVIAIFLITGWLISGAKPVESAESVTARLYKVRGRYFLLLMAVLVIMLSVTLSNLPYRSQVAVEPEYIVPVSGRIWYWEIGPIQDRDGNPLQAGSGPMVLPLGKPLEFQVTAEDVNHGFGVYDEAGQLIVQTQAMPGYVNKLVHTFTEPGEYHVLCMEYCGIAHHSMVTTITVE